MPLRGCTSRGRSARGARGGAAATLFSPATPARAPLVKRALAASPAGPPPPRPPPAERPAGAAAVLPRPRPRLALWAGADWGAAGEVRPLQTLPAPRGRGATQRSAPPAGVTSPPLTPSRPRPALPRPPPLGGVGRAAADSYFGAGWEDVTGETRAAPGTGAGAGGGGRVSGHLAAGRGGEGSGRPLPQRRVPRGGGRKMGSSPALGGPGPGLGCVRAYQTVSPVCPAAPGVALQPGGPGLAVLPGYRSGPIGGQAGFCDSTEGT